MKEGNFMSLSCCVCFLTCMSTDFQLSDHGLSEQFSISVKAFFFAWNYFRDRTLAPSFGMNWNWVCWMWSDILRAKLPSSGWDRRRFCCF